MLIGIHQGVQTRIHTVAVQDGDVRYAVLNKQMYDVHDGSLHCGSLQVAIGAAVNVSQRLAQVLSVFDVDGDELEDAILSQDTDDHGALCFVINVDKRDTTSAGLEHAATCRV